MWSICGVHDQGWAERPVFGKIRFMSYNGCKHKFNVSAFAQRFTSLKRKAEPSDEEVVVTKRLKKTKR